jgi:molybdopterin/thiamine biosynthesis adenylyltransferase
MEVLMGGIRLHLRAPLNQIPVEAIRTQVEELIETRNPSRTFKKDDLAREVDRVFAGKNPEELGVWVHYPWSHRLVHILEEDEFIELRTARNHYKITPAEQGLLSREKVGVAGLSVGQSVSVTMAMERVLGELRIADFDRLGLSNLNRLRAGVHQLDIPKVAVTAWEIAEIDPYLKVVGFPRGITPESLDDFFLGGGKLDLMIDECDDLAMKILLRQRARELRIAVLMETSDKGLVDIERFDLEPERPIFHGLIEDLDPKRLRGLSTEDKVPYVVKIIGEKTVSSRIIASMVEVGQSIKTWSQLASAVVVGGGIAADAVRRILLRQMTKSGRFFVDLETLISDQATEKQTEVEPGNTTLLVGQCPEIRTTDSPQPGEPGGKIHPIVEAAISAPSGGNCQPRKWIAQGEQTLWLCHDRARSESFLDYQDTAAMLALGAAMENAILAAHHLGHEVRLELFPERAPKQRTVARLDLLEKGDPGTESHRFDHLHASIPLRHSNRKPGQRRALEDSVIESLSTAVSSIPGARLQLLQTSEAFQEIGSTLGTGDRVRFLNQRLHTEMMSEIRWTREETEQTCDGIDIETLELSPADRAGVALCRSWPAMQLVRRIGGGFALEKMSRKAVAASSAVGLITMPSASSRDFFLGGRALQRAWLTATEKGIAFQPMSSLPYLFARLVRGGGEGIPEQQAEELRKLRLRYESVFELGPESSEILLFRLAYADAASARALRRSVADMLSLHAVR